MQVRPSSTIRRCFRLSAKETSMFIISRATSCVNVASNPTENEVRNENEKIRDGPDQNNRQIVVFRLWIFSASFLRRGWKAYYANLRDMILYLHKSDEQPPNMSIGDTNAIRLHHALAQEAIDYRKRQHVFRLKTSDWAEYLFQTSDHELMIKWIEAINLVAASFSSPPLPAAIDSSSLRFQRPLLPSVRTRHSVVRFEKEKLLYKSSSVVFLFVLFHYSFVRATISSSNMISSFMKSVKSQNN